jgi:hypothetical protein
MARARLLKPGFFKNSKLTALEPHARLLFAGLWLLADRKGRLKDDPMVIKGEIFPHEAIDVDRLLTKLARRSFITRYKTRENKYISITAFEKHQTPHVREPESIIPPPALGQHSASTSSKPDKHQSSPADPVTVNRSGSGSGNARAREVPGDSDFGPETFAGQYIRHWQQTHAANSPSPTAIAAARQLERDFGAERCIEIAGDYGWEKHPNYLREALNDPKRTVATGVGPTANARSGAPRGLTAAEEAELARVGALKTREFVVD